MRTICSANVALAAFANDCLEEETVNAVRVRPRTTREWLNHPTVRSQKISGDVLLFRLRACLDGFGMVRGRTQRRLHEAFTQAVVPLLYGNEFEHQVDRILQENNWTRVVQQAMGLTPRRWGKTVATAMFATAYAWIKAPRTPTESLINIYSTGKRASQEMGRLIEHYTRKLIETPPRGAGPTCSILRCNQERIEIQGPTRGDVRIIHFYPSNSKVGVPPPTHTHTHAHTRTPHSFQGKNFGVLSSTVFAIHFPIQEKFVDVYTLVDKTKMVFFLSRGFI